MKFGAHAVSNGNVNKNPCNSIFVRANVVGMLSELFGDDAMM